MIRIARVFARKTKASPTDALAFYGPPGLFPPDADEVHVSVTFREDMPWAEVLARQWSHIARVKVGGPATGMRGGEFRPGLYLKPGYVITSRGCPNRCWFCDAWKREGNVVRELPITDGSNILDDNLLACSEAHIRAVFAMLGRQQGPIQFTGGLEAKRLLPWHVELLRSVRAKQMFFAYDTPDDYEPLLAAGKLLLAAGFTGESKALRAYVLIGYRGDTPEKASYRLEQTLEAGFVPMAMLWSGPKGKTKDQIWTKLQRSWARPAMIKRREKCSQS